MIINDGLTQASIADKSSLTTIISSLEAMMAPGGPLFY